MKHISVPISAILAAGLIAVLAVAQQRGYRGRRLWRRPRPRRIRRHSFRTPGGQAVPAYAPNRSVQVSGSAVINVVPDRASIQLGVQSNAVTVGEVEQANSIAIQRVLKALRDLGIEEKDISTDRYIIEPVYENYDALHIRGYRINNMVAVTLRDVSQTGRPSPPRCGPAPTRCWMSHSMPANYASTATRRVPAVKAAGEKAGALAEAAGAQLGSVLTISENSWSYFNGMWSGRNSTQMVQNAVQNVAPTGAGAATQTDEPISLGQIAIHAEVGVTYGLK